MMHRVLALALAAGLAATATTAMAADFSKGSNAKEIGLVGEEKAMFSGKVVDILCELSRDCPANCGDGKRQLGVVRKADNVLVLCSSSERRAATSLPRVPISRVIAMTAMRPSIEVWIAFVGYLPEQRESTTPGGPRPFAS